MPTIILYFFLSALIFCAVWSTSSSLLHQTHTNLRNLSTPSHGAVHHMYWRIAKSSVVPLYILSISQATDHLQYLDISIVLFTRRQQKGYLQVYQLETTQLPKPSAPVKVFHLFLDTISIFSLIRFPSTSWSLITGVNPPSTHPDLTATSFSYPSRVATHRLSISSGENL